MHPSEQTVAFGSINISSVLPLDDAPARVGAAGFEPALLFACMVYSAGCTASPAGIEPA